MTSPPGTDALGPQGGDPTRQVAIDLSTCVNRYGPPPAVVELLRTIEPAELVLHPYDAADRLESVFAWATGVDGSELMAGRGASEFIWAMARTIDPSSVAVPLPCYTDFARAFPGRGFSVDRESHPTTDLLDAAMAAAPVVLISNPHNPTGTLLRREAVLDGARRHPSSTLVVDESYVDFVADPGAETCIGCDESNVVVLRSTSKFYGIAATRSGVAWSHDVAGLRSMIGPQETWGLSGLDVRVAEAAMRAPGWAQETRSRLGADGRWLGEQLAAIPQLDVWTKSSVHFRFAWTAHARQLAAAFADNGVGVRALGPAHGVFPGALRIVAPRLDERDAVADAIDAVAKAGAGLP